ncbi:hypothetical protein RMSM_07507 [Rhodopirellula maiorica SM1]|uniref:Poly(3-hydroxyalkanoate) polymerase subunit PhaE n=1 Tax=Rhodopirellula maiorica SM1 TaxID=1265738 RepID=M5RJK8_9BACT|nr:hypothetical protein [Rhodopirellula maiorica]EMI15562.1 hypothetical protein RMSM_07507 [Rhodopirellula maiorica SM1]
MSTHPGPNPAANPFVEPYVEIWNQFLEQANETTRRMMQSDDGHADPRLWQRRWMQATSQSIDAYLRSPFFLNAMKQNMDAIIETKMKVNDLQKEFTRNANIPTASDISGLFERVRGMDEMILARLSEIQDRLDKIESALQDDTDRNTRDTPKN